MTEMLPLFAIVAVVVALAAVAALVVVLWRGRNPVEPQAAVMAELAQAQSATGQRLEAMIRMLGDRPVAAADRGQRAAGFGLASARRFAGKDHGAHQRESAKAARAARRHRPRAEKHHRSRRPRSPRCKACSPTSRSAARSARGAWKSSSRTACRRSCYEFQYTLSNKMRPDCVRVPARPAPAGHRRQIPARSRHRLPGRQDRRRAPAGGRAGARRHRQASSPTSRRNI